MNGCCYNFRTSEEILAHLEASDHAGLGLGNSQQLRANGKGEYYLRDYAVEGNNHSITQQEALKLIEEAVK